VTLADEAGDDGLDNENRQLVNVKTRRGQTDFRERLRRVYGDMCAITGSMVVPLFKAAHITPHAHKTNYATSNGLLLRADIHTLFDMHLIAIDPDGQVVVSRRLQRPSTRSTNSSALRLFLSFRLTSRPRKVRNATTTGSSLIKKHLGITLMMSPSWV
jgi:predicted restriction endonuclease